MITKITFNIAYSLINGYMKKYYIPQSHSNLHIISYIKCITVICTHINLIIKLESLNIFKILIYILILILMQTIIICTCYVIIPKDNNMNQRESLLKSTDGIQEGLNKSRVSLYII